MELLRALVVCRVEPAVNRCLTAMVCPEHAAVPSFRE